MKNLLQPPYLQTLFGIIMLLITVLLAGLIMPVSLAAESAKAPTVKDLIQDNSETEQNTGTEVVSKVIPQDEFERGTPRSSVMALSKTLHQRDYQRALNYFDMRNLPINLANNAEELARELKIIADRTLWVDIETVSDDPLGHNDDGLPGHQDIIARVKTPEQMVDILLQRVSDGKGKYVWKLSNRTMAEIPLLYKHYGYGEWGDKLSRILPEYEFFGLLLWQWVMLFSIIIIAYVISWFVSSLLNLLYRKIKPDKHKRIEVFISGPVRFILFVLIIRENFDFISASYAFEAIFEARTFFIIAVAWLITGLIELGFGRLSDHLKKNQNEQATVLLRPAATLIKIIVFLIAIISWLDNLGFNVTTMLAGLGVGGIAVGLAAQKSIENLIGAITLYAAQPVRIGDFCKAGNTLGVIEEIGLRSTTMRTLDRTLVTIPNANFANLDIENLSERDKILYRHTIRLRNDTTPEQIRTVLENVNSMFKAHKEVDPEPARIRFTRYGEHSLDLEIFAYIKTSDFNLYLSVIEDLNLRILEIIKGTGAELALPAGVMNMPNRAISS